MHVLRAAPLSHRRHVLRGIGTALALTRLAASLLVGFVTATVVCAADPAAYVATLEEFPPADAGVDLSGELVTVDHVNRRGGLRLDGDFSEDRYHSAPTFSFILMPYGTVSYHAARGPVRAAAGGRHGDRPSPAAAHEVRARAQSGDPARRRLQP